MEQNPHLKAAILEAVENQLRDVNPPETSQTFYRLLKEGFSEKDAKELLARVVAVEIFEVMKKQEKFNLERFVKGLDRLPNYP